MAGPKVEKLFCVGTHHDSFRAGTPAEVVGVVMVTPVGFDPRPAVAIRFPDGTEDHVPLYAAPDSTVKNPYFAFVTEADVQRGRIPEVR